VGEMMKEKRIKFRAEEADFKQMSDREFKWVLRSYKLMGIIWNPKRKIKKIPLREGMRVVDYGCGPGRYTIPIAKLIGAKGKVFAVDICPPAIKYVKELAAKANLRNIEPTLVDSYNTGIQDSSIDLVLLIDTLHLINDCDALFQEIHRILKQDGLIFMDKGHLKISRAREIVESTNLFTIAECWGRDMLVAPKTEAY
jgi:ubiquinone/menaquinone biosynthesis C-methylase UbiE